MAIEALRAMQKQQRCAFSASAQADLAAVNVDLAMLQRHPPFAPDNRMTTGTRR
jgi:hypothetical protein